ncbi:DUF5791 family protein [Natrinema versiforme]|uniref:Uncharacterized protein n=1 Tax=Natrinema versiforme JCM 10478 TaxID=1227496 RepID=L9YBJ0_9EURY|nr:DUF5791 family protein [Natrinema versiforme]ELY71439.1 hypothetical protein C489_00686 [Natrinema versiforme JCM 10478]
MFYEQRMTVPDSPAALRAEYADDLAAVVEQRGAADAAADTDLEQATLEAISAGDEPDLTLEEAAQVQALAEGTPDPETIVTMALEHLLLGMSTAVLDVDAVESDLEIDLDAKEIHQKIEGRAPMSFAEFVHIQHVIADGAP